MAEEWTSLPVDGLDDDTQIQRSMLMPAGGLRLSQGALGPQQEQGDKNASFTTPTMGGTGQHQQLVPGEDSHFSLREI